MILDYVYVQSTNIHKATYTYKQFLTVFVHMSLFTRTDQFVIQYYADGCLLFIKLALESNYKIHYFNYVHFVFIHVHF